MPGTASPPRPGPHRARGHGMTPRDRLVGLLALSLTLAGCGSTAATGPSAAVTPERPGDGTAAPQQGDPPATAAQTPCGNAVRGQVQEVLGLDSVPAPEPAGTDDRSTCTYRTPLGDLVFSVTIEATHAAARERLETLRTELGATSPVSGRQDAYKNGSGAVVALMDDVVLSVDASALPPEHIGPDHQSETGVAIVLATGVLDSWAGRD
jgi:hypothetical protein